MEPGARIDLRGGDESWVVMSATGAVRLGGTIDLGTRGPDVQAGMLEVDAGESLELTGEVRCRAFHFGGTVYLSARGPVSIHGKVDARATGAAR